ncbi:MAG: hypothetical protein RIM83_05310 [Allomuricauda sp.]
MKTSFLFYTAHTCGIRERGFFSDGPSVAERLYPIKPKSPI